MSDTMTAGDRLAELADEILESRFEASPGSARYHGLHAWDGRLPDLGETGLRRRVEELDAHAASLDAISEDGLTLPDQVDLRLLRHECARERFEIVDWRIWHRDPLRYLEELGVTDYLVRDYAPRRDRAAGLCMHLKGVPRMLDEARANLDGPLDPTVLDTSIRAFESWAGFVDDDLAAALEGADEGDGDLRRALLQARNEASREARRFAAFLREKRTMAKPGTYAIGGDLLAEMLRREEAVDVPLSRILEIGRADLERNREQLREAAARIDGSMKPAELMQRIKADHPPAEEVLSFTRSLMDELRAFLVERQIVTIPTDTECLVMQTPPYLSWAFAMMNGTPSLSEQEYPGIYYVTPPAADWDERRTEEWLTEFSRAGLANTSVHEAWPGHFLHGLHIRRNPSRVVRTSHTYSSAEAWAHYSEQLMVEEGLRDHDAELRMLQLGDALLRNVRLLVSIGLHSGDLSVAEALWMFREDALLSEQAARTEAERGTFDPGYLNYTLGKLMLLKLREDVRSVRGADFSLREFHDDFLYWGMAPVPIVREVMLGEGAGSPPLIKSAPVPADIPEEARNRPIGPPGADMARILIVDDVRFISQMLASIFEAQGHSVQVAGDGAQALTTARSWLPELILMDVSMPQVDGLEVARQLKADPGTAMVPIMLVTSRNDPETLNAARKAGVDEYMLKPFETENLLKKATALLGGFPMHYTVELCGEIPVLTLLLEELSGNALQHLRPALNAAKAAGVGTVLLNLTKAQKIDAAAADEILAFVDEFRPGGGTLEVIHPKRGMGVRALVGRLIEKAPLHDSLDGALEAHGVLDEEPQPVRLGQPSESSPTTTVSQPGSTASVGAPTRTSTAKGVVVETHAKATIVRVSRGELGDDFFEVLAAETSREGVSTILLELKELQTLGSTEAWELAALADKTAAAGRTLRVVNPHAGVVEGLEKANAASIILRTKQQTEA